MVWKNMNQYLHEVVITAIIYRDDRYLIIQRSPTKKRFPNQWTIPGGRLEVEDYSLTQKETKDYWYNVLEKALQREVLEEVGIKIADIDYLTSLATIHKDGAPSLVISCIAGYKSGKIKLQEEEAQDFAWVTLKEAKKYDLIDGIYDELVMVEKKLSGRKVIWKRN